MQRHVLRMKDDKLPKIVLFSQLSRVIRKADCHRLGLGGCHKERFKGTRNFLGGCKEGGFEKTGVEEEHAQLCWPQAAWCCGELLVSSLFSVFFCVFFLFCW